MLVHFRRDYNNQANRAMIGIELRSDKSFEQILQAINQYEHIWAVVIKDGDEFRVPFEFIGQSYSSDGYSVINFVNFYQNKLIEVTPSYIIGHFPE